MTARISVVVPTKDSADTLQPCLASIRNQTIPVELIVIDNHSSDTSLAIANAHAHVVESAGPERSAQRNRGLELATCEYVAFIDSDMVLDERVLDEALRRLSEGSNVGGIVIPEHAGGQGYLAACRGLEKELYLGDRDVEAARVFPTELVRHVGGYRPDLVGGEDWDLSDRIEALGHGIDRTELMIWHDEGRVRLAECFRKKRYYGRGFASYLAHRTDERPRNMIRPGVYASPRLLRSPHLALGLVLLKSVEVAGLSVGVYEGRRKRT